MCMDKNTAITADRKLIGVSDMENKRISCKGNGLDIPACEYNSAWFCKHPKCKSIVLTSTMYGARPSGCPKVDEWNRRVKE